MRKVLASVALLATLWAHGEVIDGINYTLDAGSLTASVASPTSTPYAGDVVVPSTVSFGGATYQVTSVGQDAFEGSAVTSVTLPSTCTSVARWAFYGASQLRTLHLGGTRTIESTVFNGCTSLKDVYVGYTGGVCDIQGATFPADIIKNVNLHLPTEALLSQYNDRFYPTNWKNVRAILTPSQITDGTLYYQLNSDGTATVMAPYEIPGCGGPTDIGPEVEVPGTITADGREYTVTTLQAGTFYQTYNVTSVTFNEGLKTVEYETFYGSRPAISEVIFPNSLETLEESNFYATTATKSVTFGTGFKTIGDNCFYNATALTDITVMAEVPPTGSANAIPAATKQHVTLHIPAGTTAAYQASTAWGGFMAYEEIKVAASTANVDGVWYQLAGTEATVIATPEGAAPYVGSLTIPAEIRADGKTYKVVALGNSCFQNCTELTEVNLSEGLTTIGDGVFSGSAVKNLYIPNSVTTVGSVLMAANVQNVAIGSGVTSIPTGFIFATTAVKSIAVNNRVPPTVAPSGISSTFYKTAALYIPAGTYAAYSQAGTWKEFQNINEVNVAEKIAINSPTLTGFEGQTVELSLSAPDQNEAWNTQAFFPESTTWRSTNTDVASVDENGVVTLIKPGEAEIIATYASVLTPAMTPLTAVCKLTVKAYDKVVVDGVWYQLSTTPYNGEGAEFMCSTTSPVESGFPTGTEYKGDITVADFITWNGKTYAVTSVGRQSFYLQEELNSVTLPEHIRTIETAAFFKSGITVMNIPGATYNIGDNAFSDCTKLKSMTITKLEPPTSASTAFGNITSTCTLYVPRGYENVYKNAAVWKEFANIETDPNSPVPPTKLTITGGVAGVLSNATLQLTANLLPADATDKVVVWNSIYPDVATVDQNGLVTFHAQGNAVIECYCLNYPSVADNVAITVMPHEAEIDGINYRFEIDYAKQQFNAYVIPREIPYSGKVEIPNNVHNYIYFSVVGIDNNAFKNCSELTGVTLPATISSIGLSAFQNCTKLEELIIPATVKTIKGGAFSGSGLRSVIIPEGVPEVDNQLFKDCAQLTNVELPSTIETIYLMAFQGCGALTTITSKAQTPPVFFQAVGFDFPAFEESVYATCTLYVPEESVEAYATADGWSRFINIQAIPQPGVLTSIDGIRYRLNAQNNTAAVIHSNGYSGEINIPAEVSYNDVTYTVTSIDAGAFENMKEVTGVTMTDNITSIGTRSFAGSGIDVITLSQGITRIPAEAFADCSSLIAVSLPDHLLSVGEKAFYGSERIRYMFCYNFGVGDDHVLPTFATYQGDPTDYGQAFSPEIWPDCKLVIPADMFMNYKGAAGWKNFRSFVYWHPYDVLPETLTTNPDMIDAEVGQTVRVVPVVTPADATVVSYIFTNFDPEYISVAGATTESGEPCYDVTLLKEGKTSFALYCGVEKTLCEVIISKPGSVSGIDADDADVRYFDLQGNEIARPAKGQIVIEVRDGRNVRKIVY